MLQHWVHAYQDRESRKGRLKQLRRPPALPYGFGLKRQGCNMVAGGRRPPVPDATIIQHPEGCAGAATKPHRSA